MSNPFDLTGKFITDTYERLVQYSSTGPTFYDGLGNEISRPEGPTGPQGPTGPTGEIGPTGPQGFTGPTGPVNVSDTLDTVTSRGATTSNQITVGGLTANGPLSGTNLYLPNKIDTDSNRIAGWHIIEQNFIYVGGQDGNPTGIFFNPDGDRLFYCGYSTNRIYQYNLSTPWDLLSAVDSGLSSPLNISGVGGTIEDIYISPDGLNLYAISRGTDTLGQYLLASAWDLTSVSFVRLLAIGSYDVDPRGVYFKDDGTILYLVGSSTDDIYQIELGTPWDISTVGTFSSFSLNEFGIGTPEGIEFNADGTSLYIVGSSIDRITEFDLSTPWDITTATLGGYSPYYGNLAASITSLFYDSTSNKGYIIGRSSDRIYQLNTEIPTEFKNPVIFDKSITVDNNIEVREYATFRGVSEFNNTANFRSTFTTLSTTRLLNISSGNLDIGGTLTGTTNIRVGFNNHYPITDPNFEKNLILFRNFNGGKATIRIAEAPTYTNTLINGIVDIDSNADTLDHQGELSIGRTLKVEGSQSLKYKENNLYLEGNTVVYDSFTEVSDTDITLHTPDTGSGYTQVYSDAPVAEFPIVSGGNNWLQPNATEDNDGYIYRNNTAISIADYEVRATLRRQPTDGDATFWLIARYQDNDNFYALSFTVSTSYSFLWKRVGGVDTQLGALNYWVNPSGNVDGVNIDVALRVIGNEISVFYNGEFRGTAIDSDITLAGNAGFGFGAIFPSTFTSMDISNQWRITDYRVTELPSSVFSSDDSIHYINKGNVGIGTTNPAYTLDVNGSANFTSGLTAQGSSNDMLILKRVDSSNQVSLGGYSGYLNIQPDSNYGVLVRNSGDTGKYVSLGVPGDYGYLKYKEVLSSAITVSPSGVGIGTSSPQQLLDITDITSAPVLRLSRNENIGGTGWVGESLGDIEFYTNDPSAPNVYGKISVVGGPNSGNPNAGYPDGHMVFETAGQQGGSLSEKMRITDDGNVGIGTSSPVRLLHLSASDTAINPNLLIDQAGTGNASIGFKLAGSTEFNMGIDNADENKFKIHRNYPVGGNGNVLTIDGANNVGIGTTTPNAKLDVQGQVVYLGNGGSGTDRALFIANSINNTFEFNNNAGDRGVRIVTNNGTVGGAAGSKIYGAAGGITLEGANGQGNLSLTTDGKVGISTNNPTDLLHILKNQDAPTQIRVENQSNTGNARASITIGTAGNAITMARYLSNYTTVSSWASSGGILTDSGLTNGFFFRTSAGPIRFQPAGNTDRVVFDTSGNVGIGTTSPATSLHIIGNGITNQAPGNATINIDRGDNPAYSSMLVWRTGNSPKWYAGLTDTGDNPNYTGYDFMIGQTKGSPSIFIDTSDNVGIGTTTPTSKLHVNGTAGTQFRIENSFTPTGTADATGNTGDIAWDDSYLYVKTSVGWKRTLLSTF